MAGIGTEPRGGSAGKFTKKISWENKRWACDPFIVELFHEVDGERFPVNIDPKTVKIKDTRDWLEKDGEPIRGADKKWQVPVRIREEKLKELAPVGYSPESWKPPIFAIGPPKRVSQIPGRHLSTTLTVTVEVLTAAELAGAAMGAGAGMAAVGAAVAKATPRNVVPSKPVEYIVQPLKPVWQVEQEHPLPLSGRGSEETIAIAMGLPEGWDSGLTVTCSVPPEGEKKLGVEILSVSDKQSEPGNLKAELKIKNSILCMRKVTEVSNEPTPDDFELRISTKSEYLGTPLQKALIDIQPVDISLYLDKKPENQYPRETKPIRVIRKDTKGVPSRSKLAVALQHVKDLDPNFKKIQWALSDDEVDDRFENPNAVATAYIAPNEEVLTEKKPEYPKKRCFSCLAGSDDEETAIMKDKNDEFLYSTIIFASHICLQEPIGFGIIKVKVSPSGLPEAQHMDLVNPDVLKQFHRTFNIKVDLQAISDTEESE